jgi:pimeloyl-ACP methyl ester carboxylesterase
MPKFSRSGQEWILDRFVAALGIDALMPGFSVLATSPVIGFNVADVRQIAERTRGMLGMRREYLRAAARREELAHQAEAKGHSATARRQYHLSALYYGFAQYTIQEDADPEKARLHARCQECYAKVIKYAATPIEKVEIPFEDTPPYKAQSFPGLLHLPQGQGPFPCVIFIPGTDMHKEQVPNPEDNIFAKRGLACLSIDGPGQGESLLRMLKVHVETWNYERAVTAALDYLETRSEIDMARIATLGVSTGSYWSPRAALHEARHKNRIKACVGLMAQWDPYFVTEFEYAQPAFKSNYMYMAGVDDEAEFDRQARLHTLEQVIEEITCPILISQGEFDELCPPTTVERILRRAKAPHELWIWEDEHHPMGGVAIEAWETALDWILDRFEGKAVQTGRVLTFAKTMSHP